MTNSISLVIATYNRGARIASTLDSVLSQCERPDEIIVVDDCSTDNTGIWIAEQYPQVKVLSPHVNGGTSAARNFGAKAATGEVLIFLDHDDELFPYAIKILIGLLKMYPKAKAAYADHTCINRVSGIIFPDHYKSQHSFHRLGKIASISSGKHGCLYKSDMYKALLKGNLLQQPWAIYKDTFEAVGGFDEQIRFCEDWDLYLRVTRNHPIALSNEVISNHIIEGNNLHLNPEQTIMHQKVLEKRLQEEPWYHFRLVWLLKRRLAMYYKMHGDQIRRQSIREAWKHYTRSFMLWPFDYVVALRTFFLPILMIFWKS